MIAFILLIALLILIVKSQYAMLNLNTEVHDLKNEIKEIKALK